jgi:hypothetical protein
MVVMLRHPREEVAFSAVTENVAVFADDLYLAEAVLVAAEGALGARLRCIKARLRDERMRRTKSRVASWFGG